MDTSEAHAGMPVMVKWSPYEPEVPGTVADPPVFSGRWICVYYDSPQGGPGTYDVEPHKVRAS